jgi:hypothetical protein
MKVGSSRRPSLRSRSGAKWRSSDWAFQCRSRCSAAPDSGSSQRSGRHAAVSATSGLRSTEWMNQPTSDPSAGIVPRLEPLISPPPSSATRGERSHPHVIRTGSNMTSGLSERLVQRSCDAPGGIGVGPPERLGGPVVLLDVSHQRPLAALLEGDATGEGFRGQDSEARTRPSQARPARLLSPDALASMTMTI